MRWFLIASIAPALYAVSNHIDKYLLTKYFKAGKVGSLVLFTTTFCLFALPIIFIIEPTVFTLEFTKALALVLNGSLIVICLILYFHALEIDETSAVIPFYQTIPVFGFILGYFILRESLVSKEIIACSFIIFGAIILSLELNNSKIRFKKAVVFLMLTASFFYAVNETIFKLIAINAGFWISVFWAFAGEALLGLLIFIFVGSYRKQFLQVIKVNKFSVLTLNSFNEILYTFASGITYFALLLAPVALVMTVNSLQPLFVFIYGIILTIFFPFLGKESLSRKIVTQKIVAIGLILLGTVLLNIPQ